MATVQHKTPGVYLSEPNSFPPAIVGVDTAVPAFIGYTAIATDKGKTLINVPTKINSLAEYVAKFGGRYDESYYLRRTGKEKESDTKLAENFKLFDAGDSFTLVEDGKLNFYLFNSLRLFYDNGGGTCWIVSCGTYGPNTTPRATEIKRDELKGGIDKIENIVGPTMLVVPEATLLAAEADFYQVAVHMLQQCMKKQDRVAILDVFGAEKVHDDTALCSAINAFRVGLAGAPSEALRYGMAYFPFLQTSVVSTGDVSIANFAVGDDRASLVTALKAAVTDSYPDRDGKPDQRGVTINSYIAMIGSSLDDIPANRLKAPKDRTPAGMLTHSELTDALVANLPILRDMFHHAAAAQSLLPPSGAMAGVFTSVDTARGVWNAPANVGIADLIAPSYEITGDQQEDLNVPTTGKAVNAIRTFPTRGPLVWGARTLDSNSNDWKYIQVRRTMIYVEQSVKTALNSFVFAPNVATTWTTVTSMIESFLHGLWSAGGLMGGSPAEAYSVKCGLGSTMTPDDILNGNMIVHVVLQMVHPAEFIELVFTQQMLGGA
jgi:hypothetical protein